MILGLSARLKRNVERTTDSTKAKRRPETRLELVSKGAPKRRKAKATKLRMLPEGRRKEGAVKQKKKLEAKAFAMKEPKPSAIVPVPSPSSSY